MSETKLIPLELKALICSHLLDNYNRNYLEYFGRMSPYDRHSLLARGGPAAVTGVVPLDIPEVRKTQRRVAALLGKDPVELFPAKPSPRYHHGTPPYTDSEVHSIRRLLGHGTKRNRRYAVRVPPVPQNSLLGFNNGGFGGQHNNDDGDDDDGDDDGEEGLFDTSIFHDDTDPNGFKLPSVFAGASPPGGSRSLNKRHDRVIPTVSERTFIDSNLRQKGYYTDRYDSSGSYGHYSNSNSNSNHYNNHHSPPYNAAATTSSSVTSLPPLHPHQRDLVSMKMDNGDNDYYNDNGDEDDDDINKDKFRQRRKSRQGVYRDGEEEEDGVDGTSSMFRMMSLESELTRAGSLLMDENFVPMSVTITRLAQEVDDNDDASLDINSRHQQDAVSATLTETSKNKTRNSKSKSTGNDNNKSDSKYCTCKDPRPLLIPSTSPCPCCLRTGGHHETGCPGSKGPRDSKGRQAVEATLACNLCGKPIRNNRKQRKEKGGGNGKRSKGVIPTTNREASGSGHTRNPMTPETAIHRFPGGSADFHHSKRLGCSSGSLSGNTRGDSERTSSKNRNVDPSSMTTTTNDQPRVRFDEKVMTRHIYPDGDNDGEIDDTNETRLSENNDVEHSSSKKSKNKKLFVKRRNLNNSQIGQSVNIPNLGVSVHAMAYDLALRDAQIMASSRKNGRRSQGTLPGDISNGTVFSYFPLLKRPLSENDKRDIGIKAHEVRKVKPKNYMKHIFGKVKIADYYPGGKKWRED